MVDSSIVIDSTYFHITIQKEPLSVVSVPNQFVAKCAWWLIREYGLNRSSTSSFRSILVDDDGLSLVCDPAALSTLRFLIKPGEFTVSPQMWCTLIINVTGTAFEFPGAVYYLANALSREGLSIFHISTFESEVFLVQQNDLEQVLKVLKDSDDPNRLNEFLGDPTSSSSISEPVETEKDIEEEQPMIDSLPDAPEEDQDDEDPYHLDESWITPAPKPVQDCEHESKSSHSSNSQTLSKEGLYLTVLPSHVILAKLPKNFDLSSCSNFLIKLLLYDQRFSPLERLISTTVEGKDDTNSTTEELLHEDKNPGSFMWGIWECENEITILMDESDIDRFPSEALITSPQRWRIIKLCGRPIAFDETGIVRSMSKIGNIPSLNISTTTTNCALVPDELLDSTLETLSGTLGFPVKVVNE